MGPKSSGQPLAKQVKLLQQQIEEANALYQKQVHIASELEREKAFSETLIYHMPAALCYVDRDYRLKIINRAKLRMLGRPPGEDVLGKSLFEVLPQLESLLRPTFEAIFATGCPQAIENFKITHSDGSSYWDLTQIPICGDNGVEGVLMIGNDITDRIKREQLQQQQFQQLRDADRMKDEILSIISHEIRTPLNFIMGFASLLEDGAAGKLCGPQADYVSKILKGAEQMTGLVENLLVMSRMAAGKLDCVFAPVSLAELLADLKNSFEPRILEKRCTVMLTVPKDLPPILGDSSHLYRVFSNLLDNAIKFSPSESTIRIRARKVSNSVSVEIKDQGIGISADHLSRIFERFYQVDMSLTRQTGGIGMGLAIAKGMIEAHGGHISIDSTPGEGSTFIISLPISSTC